MEKPDPIRGFKKNLGKPAKKMDRLKKAMPSRESRPSVQREDTDRLRVWGTDKPDNPKPPKKSGGGQA